MPIHNVPDLAKFDNFADSVCADCETRDCLNIDPETQLGMTVTDVYRNVGFWAVQNCPNNREDISKTVKNLQEYAIDGREVNL